HFRLRRRYLHQMLRIFQEKPLFVIPRGQSVPDAEEVSFSTADGLKLRGCYLRTPHPRRGVILFGLEFGSNPWTCTAYSGYLRDSGYDIFCFEPRNQGDSERLENYEPLQWVTGYEVRDFEAAVAYLKGRPDADPCGIGFFGVSKGAGAGLIAAAHGDYVRCAVTDGLFATYTTMVPYLRLWFKIYSHARLRQALLPAWHYGRIGLGVPGWVE